MATPGNIDARRGSFVLWVVAEASKRLELETFIRIPRAVGELRLCPSAASAGYADHTWPYILTTG